MSRVSRVLPWLLGAAVVVAVTPARAQSNLDAGKTPAQIFSDTCHACHRSPREIRQTSPAFLREHYTTGMREAAAMAAYLAAIGSDQRAVQQRRPPVLGTGQGSETAARPSQAPDAGQGRPAETQALPATGSGRRTPATAEGAKPLPGQATAAIRPRRPSDSIEAGKLPVAASGGADAPQPGASTALQPNPIEVFEE